MKRVGVSDLPLHPGRCPPWLFKRMKTLAGLVSEAIILEYGTDEFLRRLANPYFFQSFGCVLGFDWHSSGVTTTTMGALKEALDPEKHGIAVLGGKGGTSRKTPFEIESASQTFPLTDEETEFLKYASRMAAKVDSSAVQDGYQLYHHNFILAENGNWAVVQQGMNNANRYARRYHWLSQELESFVSEPHTAICCDFRGRTLDMTAKDSKNARKASVDLVKDGLGEVRKLLVMGSFHWIDNSVYKRLLDLNEFQPRNYEELLAFQGVGPKTIRALALTSKLVYGTEASWKDPVQFSFSRGGKDGTPFPVERDAYDESSQMLRNALDNAKLGNKEKLAAIRRLENFA
ncbi:MAG: DUF763 domain-containing protein [Candidatus Aenigmatarchaeota archaeon]